MFSEIKAAGLIRVIRLVRLLKLLKLAKQPRIMAKLRQFVTMPIKQQTLIKYFFIIFFIIHWTACTLRLLTSFAVGDCRPKGSDMHSGLPFDDECARTYLNTNRRWGQGPWSQYASAIIWSIGAMSGEAYLPANMEETVLNTLVMLMGIVVMAFLVGELSNILGNFDPVGNEFEQTVDNLDARARRPIVLVSIARCRGSCFGPRRGRRRETAVMASSRDIIVVVPRESTWSSGRRRRDAPRRPTSSRTNIQKCCG